MKTRIGRLENMALSYARMRNMRLVRTADISLPLHLTLMQGNGVMRRLARGGIITRIRPGTYLIPDHMPIAGEWTPDESQAISALMNDVGAQYQVCGPNAFNRYGFDEQIPNRIYAYNNKISAERTVGTISMTLIKVAQARLGDTDSQHRPDGGEMIFSSRVRTLVDAVYDWALFNTLPRAYRWIGIELAGNRIQPADLVRCTLTYGDIGTRRRLGFLLEKLDIPPPILSKLARSITSTSAYIPWIPNRSKRGRISKRWGVIDNSQPGEMDELSTR